MPDTPAINASPLIFLAKADRLPILRAVAPNVVVPRPVFNEIAAYADRDPVRQRVLAAPFLQVIDVESVPPAILAWDLGPGESALLAYALPRPGTECILDDLKGRRCAEALGIPVLGTLGVAVRAKRQGLIPAAKPLIDELRSYGMFLSAKLMAQALRAIGE